MTVPDILTYLNILKTSGTIRLAQLVSIFISVSLAAAGVIHLVSCFSKAARLATTQIWLACSCNGACQTQKKAECMPNVFWCRVVQ